MAELKQLATHCKFEAYLDEALRDRFVFRLKSIAIQKKLLAEKMLSFTTAVETAQSMESVDQQARGEGRKPELEIQNIYSPSSNESVTPCYHCGTINHDHSSKEAICLHCNKQGQLQV